MEDLTDLKKYLKKLQNTIARDIDFKFFGLNFIKKNKIDDVWCCILASLPEIFKKNLKSTFSKKLNSIIAYNHLFDALKSILSKSSCFIGSESCITSSISIHTNI